MDLRSWILADVIDAHERFATSIAAHVPRHRWRERPGDEGASIAALRFHASRHRDLAIASQQLQARLAAARGNALLVARQPCDLLGRVRRATRPSVNTAGNYTGRRGPGRFSRNRVTGW